MLVDSFVVRIKYNGPPLSEEQQSVLEGEVQETLDGFEFSQMIRERLKDHVEEVDVSYLKVTCEAE